MGSIRTKAKGRKAAKARLTRRTDQFHFAFTMTVATPKITAPMATLVKKSQLET